MISVPPYYIVQYAEGEKSGKPVPPTALDALGREKLGRSRELSLEFEREFVCGGS
jgi:hypothetical protein